MKQIEITTMLSSRLRLVRNEYNLTQDRMAEMIGMSKKTLVQIEKERSLLSWSATVAFATLFADSEVMRLALGGEPVELVQTVALSNLATPREKTLGGKVWWNDLRQEGNFRLQQNIISGHYRIIDGENRRWYSSFDRTYINEAFARLVQDDQSAKSGW